MPTRRFNARKTVDRALRAPHTAHMSKIKFKSFRVTPEESKAFELACGIQNQNKIGQLLFREYAAGRIRLQGLRKPLHVTKFPKPKPIRPTD